MPSSSQNPQVTAVTFSHAPTETISSFTKVIAAKWLPHWVGTIIECDLSVGRRMTAVCWHVNIFLRWVPSIFDTLPRMVDFDSTNFETTMQNPISNTGIVSCGHDGAVFEWSVTCASGTNNHQLSDWISKGTSFSCILSQPPPSGSAQRTSARNTMYTITHPYFVIFNLDINVWNLF